MRYNEFCKLSEGTVQSTHLNGLELEAHVEDDTIQVTAYGSGRALGRVLFVVDGQTLLPQDLLVDERYQGQGIAQTMYDWVKSQGYQIRRSGQQTDAGSAFWQKHRPGQNVWEAQTRLPAAIEEFLDSLNPDDCGVEDIGAYRIHFEGFTSDCKSSSDYRRNPEAVYQQVYQDFIQREGGQRPLVQDMVGDERFPILYSIFRRKKLNEIGDKPQPYKPNPKRRRSLFHSEVDGNWVDVFFDRSPINGSLQITFTVNQNYEPAGPSSASRSTIRILSTVLNIIKQQLPEYIKKARPPAVTFTAKGQGRADLYRKYFVPVVQNILGPRWQLEDLPGETTLFSWRPVKQTVSENQQATARQVLDYINRTHHEPFQPGEKMYQAVLAHPRWQLQRVPLLNLYIPDQEYDDVDYDDAEPEADPYGRVMTVEPGHAGEISQNLVDQYPIVIDANRYIIDGNHRAWAAKYLLNRDYIDAWVPVEQIKEVNYPDELTVSDAIQDHFYRRGYSLAGEGRDQMAFESPRGTIVKVLGIGESEREDIVKKYVAYFVRNQHNPYYPKIYNTGEFTLDDETYFVYEMEYLTYVANEEATLDYLEKLMSAVDRGLTREFMSKHPVPQELDADELYGLLESTEDLIEALGGMAPLDLSNIENLRRRENGHLVIMDPFSL